MIDHYEDESDYIDWELLVRLSKRKPDPRIIHIHTPYRYNSSWLVGMFTKPKENKNMKAVLSPDDLKRGDLVDGGWYPCEISNYTEKEAKTDKSTNCVFEFKVIDGKSKGAIFSCFFNEKALGFGKKLWFVLFGPPDPATGYPTQLETTSFKSKIGTKLKVYIKRGKSTNGNEFNDVADFDKM